MHSPLLSTERARDLIARLGDVPVLVVGDLMLDRFIVGRVARISPEAPVPVVQFQSDHMRLGGAANVASNVLALGGQASLVGVVGRDAPAGRLRDHLIAKGVDVDGVVEDPGRPTIEKVRIVTERNQHVARIDYEHDDDVGGAVERDLVQRIGVLAPRAKAIIVSDYLKGTVTRPIVEALRGAATPGVPLVVDPKVPHLAHYAGATLITPNRLEAEEATHRRIRTAENAREAAQDFRLRAQCDGVLITLSERGMWLSYRDTEVGIASVAREVFDVAGAGDTVIATLALALACGATMTEAAVLANYAAGIVVGKFGPATVTPEELLAVV